MTSHPPRYFTIPAGTPPNTCRSARCGKRIYWIEHPSGERRIPVDPAGDPQCRPPTDQETGRGISHFATCVDADRFRKPRTA